MRIPVIIVAAGAGTRAGGKLPKQYQSIGGKSVLRRTVEAFLDHPAIGDIRVVISPSHREIYQKSLGELANRLRLPILGGDTRQESVLNGLLGVMTWNRSHILIHDAARPFVSSDVISRVFKGLDGARACIPAVPIADTLKRVDDHTISETVDRSGLWAAQTPQGFRHTEIVNAHRRAAECSDLEFTDDASIAEWAGIPVSIVDGDPENRKITTAADLAAADRLMRTGPIRMMTDVRVGHGYDVHAFEPGDRVTVCGVEIPHDSKLKGHSDADVGLHTITDAILGALCAGDIGKHFPPTDPKWKGADSRVFLQYAAQLVSNSEGEIAHVDLTLICQAPKMRPHVDAMRRSVAKILRMDRNRVSVKATTTEHLGFTGREEGMAAVATVTVRLPELNERLPESDE